MSEVQRQNKRDGILVIVGGIMIHLVLGTFYLWGGISVYVASYMRLYDPEFTITSVNFVFPTIGIFQCLSMMVSMKVAQKLGFRRLGIIISFCISGTIAISSLMNNFWTFVLFYGILFGLCTGIIYVVPLYLGWQYFPKNKGAVSGAVIGGYGFSTFFFNFIARALVNPDNVKASILGQDKKLYFGEDIARRVPGMLRINAIIFLVLFFIGALLQKPPRKNTENQQENLLAEGKADNYDNQEIYISSNNMAIDKKECPSLRVGFRTIQFWMLIFIIVTCSSYGLFVAALYKSYGYKIGYNDNLMTWVGSFAALMNGCSRPFWATLTDKFGFKKVFWLIITIQSILAATFHIVSQYKALFFIWTCFTMFCEGGYFAIFPAVTSKIYGTTIGSKIYGFIFTGFIIALLLQYGVEVLLLQTLNYSGVFWLFFGFSVISGITSFFFNDHIDWDERDSEQIVKYNL